VAPVASLARLALRVDCREAAAVAAVLLVLVLVARLVRHPEDRLL
jgi:hypothetical protein